jgi:hypothetical protein
MNSPDKVVDYYVHLIADISFDACFRHGEWYHVSTITVDEKYCRITDRNGVTSWSQAKYFQKRADHRNELLNELLEL